jgi:hypothetical protein
MLKNHIAVDRGKLNSERLRENLRELQQVGEPDGGNQL